MSKYHKGGAETLKKNCFLVETLIFTLLCRYSRIELQMSDLEKKRSIFSDDFFCFVFCCEWKNKSKGNRAITTKAKLQAQ